MNILSSVTTVAPGGKYCAYFLQQLGGVIRQEKAGSLYTCSVWDFVASNLNDSVTQYFDSSPIVDRNKLLLDNSGKKNPVVYEKK